MVVAIVGDDQPTIKRYFSEGETVRLQPANKTMPATTLPAADVQIQGVVVGMMRKF